MQRDDDVVFGTNRGWDTGANGAVIADASAHVGAFALAPGSADCALIATLPPGAYTAPLASADGAGGLALVEPTSWMAVLRRAFATCRRVRAWSPAPTGAQAWF